MWAADDRPYDTVGIGLSWTGDREGRPYMRLPLRGAGGGAV